jgi:hypothetical protein
VRRPTEGTVAIGGLIFFSLWLFIALPLLALDNKRPHNAAPNQCSAEESKHHGFWEKAGCDPVAYFTLWLVAFTGVLAVSTIGLWAVTAWGVRNQRRDTEILQRAYLNVEPGGIAPYTSPTASYNPDFRVVAHIRIRNTGNLPARHVRYHLNTEFSPNPEWSEERFAQLDWSEDYFRERGELTNAVGPTGNNVIPAGSTMNQGGPTRFLQDKGWVYVWGIVTYDDGFAVCRVTRFCHRYNCKRFAADGDGMRRIKPKYGRHYDRGNDAT